CRSESSSHPYPVRPPTVRTRRTRDVASWRATSFYPVTGDAAAMPYQHGRGGGRRQLDETLLDALHGDGTPSRTFDAAPSLAGGGDCSSRHGIDRVVSRSVGRVHRRRSAGQTLEVRCCSAPHLSPSAPLRSSPAPTQSRRPPRR